MNDQETIIAALQEARSILHRDTGSGLRDREATIHSLRTLLDGDQIVHALERIGQQNQPRPANIVESPWS